MKKNTINVYTKVDEHHKVRYYTTFEVWSVDEIKDFIEENHTAIRFAQLDCEQGNDEIHNYRFYDIPYEEDDESKVKHVAIPKFDEYEAIEWRAKEDARLFFAEWKLDVDEVERALIALAECEKDYFYSDEWKEYTDSLSDGILDNYYTCYGRNCKNFSRESAIEQIESDIRHWANKIWNEMTDDKTDYYGFQDEYYGE